MFFQVNISQNLEFATSDSMVMVTIYFNFLFSFCECQEDNMPEISCACQHVDEVWHQSI